MRPQFSVYEKHARKLLPGVSPALLAILFLVSSLVACSRTHHRINADREAYRTIAERNCDPRWAEADLDINMDSRSRYFDPYNPDCPPMPADDPASHRYMHCVDGKKGWKHWGEYGLRAGLENPQWQVRLAEYTELNDEGQVKLDVDSAVRLAYVHAPLHQSSLETLYLSSLDVTGERFRLDTQFFGGNSANYRHTGNLLPATIGFVPGTGYVVGGPFPRPEGNRLNVLNDISASRRLATAGEVLVGFANSFALEFTGGDVSLASSLANFSFIQPLLRGGGRHIALEQLTLSERRLLANLRAYSQFRQGFFTQILIGELGVNGPQRGGQGTVLQSFSGFGGVGGYLDLLQQAQRIRNTEDNLRLQLRTRDRLEALYDNDFIDIVQVDQFRQNIEVTRANLLDQTNGLELAVDNYKTQILGLPPDLPAQVDEKLVEGFQLIPLESGPVVNEVLALQKRIGNAGGLLEDAGRIKQLEATFGDLDSGSLDDAELFLLQLQAVVDAVVPRAKVINSDLQQYEALINERKQGTDDLNRNGSQFDGSGTTDTRVTAAANRLGDREGIAAKLVETSERLDSTLDSLNVDNLTQTLNDSNGWVMETIELIHDIILVQSFLSNLESEPQRSLQAAEALVRPVDELFQIAMADLEQMEKVVPVREQVMRPDEKQLFQRDRERLYERFDELRFGEVGFEAAVVELRRIQAAATAESRERTIVELNAWVQSFVQLVERLALIPAQARLEVITVEKVELEPELAFQIALDNRLDFMNGRAALVDRWRAIQIAANALQSNLSFTGGGDIATARNNPVDFRASTSSLRLGVEFDAPLARLLERNGYRETLIQYQRSRRDLIQSRDSLQRGLRALLRTLEQRRLQLEIQRRAVSIALRRVEQTQLALLTPPPPVQPGARPQINPTTAINLLGAQSSLQNSQNSFLAAWLNYYAARLRLYRELGIMQLDPSGRWVENSLDFGSPNPIGDTIDSEPLPPPIPVEVAGVKED